jgi:hypothetical protein
MMFIKDNDQLYDILGDAEKFDKLLQVVVETVRQQILCDVPALVLLHLKNELKYRDLKEQFFVKNPELVNYKAQTGQALNEIAANQPDLPLEKVFELGAIRAKELIRRTQNERPET